MLSVYSEAAYRTPSSSMEEGIVLYSSAAWSYGFGFISVSDGLKQAERFTSSTFLQECFFCMGSAEERDATAGRIFVLVAGRTFTVWQLAGLRCLG